MITRLRTIMEELAEQDIAGKELTLYHGTKADFDKFDLKYFNSGSGDGGWLGRGVYLTNEFTYAHTYGDVLVCKVTVNKPYVIRGYAYSTTPEQLKNDLAVQNYDAITKKLSSEGYDSVVLTYEPDEFSTIDEDFIEMCVFDPTKVEIIKRYDHDDDSKEVKKLLGYKV